LPKPTDEEVAAKEEARKAKDRKLVKVRNRSTGETSVSRSGSVGDSSKEDDPQFEVKDAKKKKKRK
jgi:hypothetical protein